MRSYKFAIGLLFVSLPLLLLWLIRFSEIFKNFGNTHNIVSTLQPICLIYLVIFITFSFDKIKRLIQENGIYNLYLPPVFIFGFVVRYFVVHPQAERLLILERITSAIRNTLFGPDIIDFKLNGWAVLLRLSLLPFPKTLNNVLLVNIIMGSLMPLLFFFLVKLLFGSKRIAFISTCAASISPLFLYISSTESATSPSIFFATLTLIFLFFYLREGNMNLFIISLLFMVLTVQMRAEYVLILPILLFALVQWADKKNIKRPMILFFSSIILLAPYLAHVLIFYDSLSGDRHIHSQIIDKSNPINSYLQSYIGNSRKNLIENVKILFSNGKIPIQIVLLAIYGIFVSLKKWRKESYFLLFYLLTFFFAYTFLHYEGFKSSHAKYIPSILLPLIVFSSVGLNFALKTLTALRKSYILLPTLLTLIIILFPLNNYVILDTKINKINEEFNRELLFFKKNTLNVDTTCRVYSNGFGGPFPYYYPFDENPFSIDDFNDLEKILTRLDEDNCSYFYQGIYSKTQDRTEDMSRIYDTNELDKRLKENGFHKVFSYELNGKRSILWKYP